MKLPIALLALLANSGAYAKQVKREETKEYHEALPKCKNVVVGDFGPQPLTEYDVAAGSTMVIKCETGFEVGRCFIYDFEYAKYCEFSNPCEDINRGYPGGWGPIISATGGTVKGIKFCSLMCLGCKLLPEESLSEDYALDSFDMITKE